MPIAPTYPGVYVEEIPSGAHPITGVPTAVGAFIGWFPKGTTNQAVELLSWADVEREYGGLNLNSDASFALYQFFLNGGSRAWAVRIGLAQGGGTPIPFAAASVNVPKSTGGSNNNFTVSALNEGKWGNDLRVQLLGGDTADRFDLVVQRLGSANGRPAVIKEERFRGLTATSLTDPNYLPTAVNGVSQLVTVAPTSGSAYFAPKLSGVVSTGAVTSLDASAGGLKVAVTMGGSGPTDVFLPAVNMESPAAIAQYLQSAIRTARGSDPTWALATVTVTQGNLLQITSGIGDNNNVLVADSGSTTASVGLKLPTTASAGAYQLINGGDGISPTATEYVGSAAGGGSGMFALENTDFTLLSIPSVANWSTSSLDPFDHSGYATVVSNAITYCQTKRALFLIDPPDNAVSAVAIQNWIGANSSVRDSYTALYYPRVSVPDPTQNFQPRSIGPSGTIAGLMARIDTNRGVWKAPAGTEATLRGLQHIDTDLTDPENGILNPIAVNCLRTFPAYGNVSWGARTLAGSDSASSDYKYVPVRRLANFLESSLQIGLKWVVFEPNDEPLWSQIRLNIGSFMQSLFRQGAFAGLTPRDAYVVKCDSSTTTPDDQAKGVVNVLVGFAPLRPAEFVILQIQQIAGQTHA